MIHSPPYSQLSDAYSHLLKYNDFPNTPKEKPNAPVTLFYRNTFINYRPYQSFEAIARYMNWCVFKKNVFVNIEHLADTFRPMQARKLIRMATGRKALTDKDEAFEELWEILQRPKLVVMKTPLKNRGNSYLFDLNALASTNAKFTRQCSVIIKAIVAAQQSAYTADELRFLANDLHKHGLKTKQHPFKILQYYLPQLHDAGFVEYPRKEYSKENGDD